MVLKSRTDCSHALSVILSIKDMHLVSLMALGDLKDTRLYLLRSIANSCLRISIITLEPISQIALIEQEQQTAEVSEYRQVLVSAAVTRKIDVPSEVELGRCEL